MKRLVRVAPWIVFGPLSAPFVIRGSRALQRGETALAALWFIGLAMLWVDLPLIARWINGVALQLAR